MFFDSSQKVLPDALYFWRLVGFGANDGSLIEMFFNSL